MNEEFEVDAEGRGLDEEFVETDDAGLDKEFEVDAEGAGLDVLKSGRALRGTA